MKICILNGSPKSNRNSITMYYAAYLANAFPEHTYAPLEIGRQINKLQRDTEEYRKIIDTVHSADIVVWVFPIYEHWAPAQLVRFIELVSEHGDEKAFTGKYATLLTTSIRYFDFTAHHYISQVSAGWGMKFVRGFSAEMEGMKDSAQRENLKTFFARFLRRVEKQRTAEALAPLPLRPADFLYEPAGIEEGEKTPTKRVTLITDACDQDLNLLRMIDTVKKSLAYPVTQIHLHDAMASNAWCSGCVRCMATGQCSQKDNFAEAILQPLKSSDLVIIATALRGRGISSRLKMFMDRTLVFGHAPGLSERRPVILILVSGPLRQLPYAQQMLYSFFKHAGASDVIIVTDEAASSEELTQRLVAGVEDLMWTSESGLYMPELFPEKAGHMLLRDFMYKNRAVLPLDHLTCIKQGLYKDVRPNIANDIFNRLGVIAARFPFAKNWLAKNSLKVVRGRLERAHPQELPWE